MKRILITGRNSYTGNALKEYLSQWPDKYETETISLRGESWKSESFSGFDSVFHVAGIAHDSTKGSDRDAYYAVNSQLAFYTARKAMNDGVKQFIFMSSSIIYGDHQGLITHDTEINPSSYYGESKVKAEEMLRSLESERFRVCILRCPMIYGRGCKGNYVLLSKIARVIPAFPYVKNFRSMLYVKNMAEFVRLIVDDNAHGLFWPQNEIYSNTSELVRMIAGVHGRNIRLLHHTESAIRFMSRFSGKIRKAFGSLAYDMSMSNYRHNYRACTLYDSIHETESLL
jgi:UDP-glucose 4-epimerase